MTFRVLLLISLLFLGSTIGPGAFAEENPIPEETTESSSKTPSVLLSISPGLSDAGPVEAVDKVAAGPQNSEGANTKSTSSGPGDGWIAPVSVEPEIHFGLSDDTYELAKLWGLVPSLNTLHQNPKHLSGKQMDVLLKRVVVRQDISESVMSKMFEIRTTLNAIDKQIAKSEEISALLAEKRDKAIRFNTYADLVAGGITGMLSGALRLGTLEFVTPDVVDVVEGVAQAGLAGYALKNENIKHHIEKGIPNLLAKIFYPHEKRLKEFPDSVWTFLNSVPSYPANNQLTRRELLVKRWTEKKFCLKHKRGRKKVHHVRVKHVAGVHGGKAVLTIELLEDRVAMLEDLRAQVTMMEEHLAEIFERAKKY